MATDVYEKLAQHLDNLPAGFSRTESGVELRILRRLFTPEDAELALHLTLIPEEPRGIARRANIPVEEAARRLEEMEQKRLILAIEREGKPPQYQAMQFFVGLLEGQVNKLDQELIQEFEEYMSTAFDADFWQKAPQLRAVPVGESISTQTEVMPYERAEELVRAHDTFSVSNCICRQEMRIMGEGCDKPLESCLQFGAAAEHGRGTDPECALGQRAGFLYFRGSGLDVVGLHDPGRGRRHPRLSHRLRGGFDERPNGQAAHLWAHVVAGGGVPPAHPAQPIVRAFDL